MSAASGTTRLPWADVAKGGCIVLVVLWHVTRKDLLHLAWEPSPALGAWGALSELLLPVRMPLFFLVSGLFAARQLTRPWSQVGRTRVAPLLYLFLLWTLVHSVLFRATPGFETAVAGSWHELAVQLTVTPGNLWYLLALATYVAVARATRHVPHVALAAAAVLSVVAAAELVPTPGNRAGLLANLVWFLLGTRLAGSRRLDALTARRRPVLLAALTASFVAASLATWLVRAGTWPGVRPLLGLMGVAAGVLLAAAVARRRRPRAVLAALGRRTLPVYVLHLPLVALVHLGSARVVDDGPGWLAAVYPPVVTAAVVGACLLLHRVALRCGAWWLFTAPWLPRPARAVVRPRPAISAAG